MRDAVWTGYFADPFVTAMDDGWIAYGTGRPGTRDGVAFEALVSDDLLHWRSAGGVLRVDPSVGTDYWAPEVVRDRNGWWMLFSAGRGIDGHHLRVAHANSPTGPFTDVGVDLTPDESFAIDAHPFVDHGGARYLFFARDVLDAERPGTHLAVRRMRSWTEPEGETRAVLAPNAGWQRYAADREMYGRRLDWYTLEGPAVVARPEGLVLLYSGGSWEGPGYGVAAAVAPTPLGPWQHASSGAPDVLSTAITGQRGPGHCSVIPLPDGGTAIAYHAWDAEGGARRMHIARLGWDGLRPVVDPDAGIGPRTP